MPTSVFFIRAAPARGGGYELVPPGGGVEESTPAGGGVETGAMPTSVLFICIPARAGGCELVPPECAFMPLDDAPGGGFDGLVVPVGAGVAPCGAMPSIVLFMASAAGGAAFIGSDDGVGRGGLSVAPQTPHVAVSGLACDPHRGQTLMRADYFSRIQNAMA
jgi:hypothetical protein